MGIGGPSRREQARIADRVRELAGAPAPAVGSHRRPEPAEPPEGGWPARWGLSRGGPSRGGPSREGLSRWEPSRPALAGAALLVLAVVVAVVWWYSASRAPAVPVVSSGSASPVGASASPSSPSSPSSLSSSAPSAAAPAGTAGATGEIVVDVAGKVVHPGVYSLPPNARVVDALKAAGGPLPGVSTVSLNLAAPLHDGDQVVVGVPGAGVGAAAADGSGGSAGTSASGLVDLNTATLAELDALPGVGPVLAQHILDWRTAHGGFTSVDQLNSVSGIGEAKFADLKSLVST